MAGINQNSGSSSSEELEIQEELDQLTLAVTDSFQKTFTTSFEDFSTFWVENCKLVISDSDKRFIMARISRFTPEHIKELLQQLRLFLQYRFIRLRVRSFLDSERNEDEFLNLFAEFVDYFEHVCEQLGSMFTQIDISELQGFLGNRTIQKYLRYYGLSALYKELKHRLKLTFIDKVQKVRKNFAYTSIAIYDALTNSKFAKSTALFRNFFPSDDYRVCLHAFRDTALQHVEAVIDDLSDHISQKRFLVTARRCMEAEKRLFRALFRPHVTDETILLKMINQKFCKAHLEREEAGVFRDYKKALVLPAPGFDALILRDLFQMYVRNGSSYSGYFVAKLKEEIRRAFRYVLQIYSPLKYTRASKLCHFQHFRRCIEKLSDLAEMVEERLGWVPMFPELKTIFFESSSELEVDSGLRQSSKRDIEESLRSAVSYLCAMNDSDESEVAHITLIGGFFRYIVRQSRFMKKLFEKMQTKLLSCRTVNISRLLAFQKLETVGGRISGNILNLIRDIEESGRNHEDIRTEFEENAHAPSIRSSFAFKEQDWETLKDKQNLLVETEKLVDLRNTVEANLKLKQKFDDKEIRPADILSTVTIQTSLFTEGRPFTTINLLLYQAMILNLFRDKKAMRVRDIYCTMIRKGIEEDEQLVEAEKLVGRLIHSLTEPFPLLVTAFNPLNPDPEKVVVVNKVFKFRNAKVSLFNQNLTRKELDNREESNCSENARSS